MNTDYKEIIMGQRTSLDIAAQTRAAAYLASTPRQTYKWGIFCASMALLVLDYILFMDVAQDAGVGEFLLIAFLSMSAGSVALAALSMK